MIDFILKSSVLLFILIVVYKLFLENEKMHQFNRFYLIGSLIVSLLLPFITIEIIQEISTSPFNQNLTFEGSVSTTTSSNHSNYYLIAFAVIYGIVTALLFYRFFKNMNHIFTKSKSNTTLEYQNAVLVLVKEKTLPYTFLNKIFIYEEDYQNRKIESELFTHELIHVNQKHTLDVLLIETLKTTFWFNPIFIYYKKAMQLNHEFLADEKVVKSHHNVPFYQNLLLSKASVNPTFYLASNLNYSVTKKRLIMMTKKVSKTKVLFYKILLLPLFFGLIFFMCIKSVEQDKTTTNQDKNAPKIIYTNKTPSPNWNVNVTQNGKQPTKQTEINGSDKGDSINKEVKKIEETYNTEGEIEKPSYPGGIEAFYRFVGENFKMPIIPDDVKLKGKVYITFMIEKDGSLSDFKILRDIGYGTGDEAVRVLKLCPNWIPGKENGEAVRTMYSLPITLQSN